MDTDLTHLIERIETFEDRCGVRIEAVHARQEEYTPAWVLVNGELHPCDGVHLRGDTEVLADVYDSAGRLVAKGSHTFSASKFYGFETFSLLVQICGDVSKIRLYPKPG
jgi:lipopolysaccharide biosynthesis protein